MKMKNDSVIYKPVLWCFLLIIVSSFMLCGCHALNAIPFTTNLPVTTTFAVTKRSEAGVMKRLSSVTEIIYDNGERYAGFMKDGLPNGYGMKYYPDGARFEGNWQNGYENGMGTYYFPNGDWLEVVWRNGVANGPGTYFRANGEPISGLWKDNEYVENSAAMSMGAASPTETDVTTQTLRTTTEPTSVPVR